MATQRNLPLITSNQNGYVSHNTALQQIDALAFGAVISRSINNPASIVTVNPHDLYVLPSAGAGAWVGYLAGDIAYRSDVNTWIRYVPNKGLTLFSVVNSQLISWTGTAWVVTSGGILPGVSNLSYPTTSNNITLPNVETIRNGAHFVIDGTDLTGEYEATVTLPGNFTSTISASTFNITVINAPQSVNSIKMIYVPGGVTTNGTYPMFRQNESFFVTLTFDGFANDAITASGFSSGYASSHINYTTSGANNDIVSFDFPYTSQQIFVSGAGATGSGNFTIQVDGDLLDDINNRVHCEVFMSSIPVAYTNFVVNVTGATPGQGILTRARTHNYQKIVIDFDTSTGRVVVS